MATVRRSGTPANLVARKRPRKRYANEPTTLTRKTVILHQRPSVSLFFNLRKRTQFRARGVFQEARQYPKADALLTSRFKTPAARICAERRLVTPSVRRLVAAEVHAEKVGSGGACGEGGTWMTFTRRSKKGVMAMDMAKRRGRITVCTRAAKPRHQSRVGSTSGCKDGAVTWNA